MENATTAGPVVPAVPTIASEIAKASKAKAKAKGDKPKAKGKAPAKMGAKDFVAKFREGTIGRLTVELIVAGEKTNDEILKAVKGKHKDASTTSACIAWYRSKARAAGVIK